jgi:hypothetical protein
MSWAVYGTIFRITTGYGASFTVTGGFLNAATITLKRDGRIFKLASVFKEARKNLAFDYLGN